MYIAAIWVYIPCGVLKSAEGVAVGEGFEPPKARGERSLDDLESSPFSQAPAPHHHFPENSSAGDYPNPCPDGTSTATTRPPQIQG